MIASTLNQFCQQCQQQHNTVLLLNKHTFCKIPNFKLCWSFGRASNPELKTNESGSPEWQTAQDALLCQELIFPCICDLHQCAFSLYMASCVCVLPCVCPPVCILPCVCPPVCVSSPVCPPVCVSSLVCVLLRVCVLSCVCVSSLCMCLLLCVFILPCMSQVCSTEVIHPSRYMGT